jgi:predicted nuclease with TOPRIM domain
MDSILTELLEKYVQRAEIGKAKYNMDMDRDDLSITEWVSNAQEEAMDLSIYLTKIKRELEFKNNQLETLIKVIKSQEEEIYQLKKQDYTQSKRRAWHY